MLIICVFLFARAVCWELGVGFDFDNLDTWWQIADPELLRTRLLPTVFYLHSQPPLFNLLIGLGLKAGDNAFPLVMAGTYGVISLAGILCLRALGQALLGSRWVSLAIALWFCVSPDVLLFNEKLFYDGLVPWLLCIGFWGLYAGLARGKAVWLTLGFGTLAAVVLLRSMFHPAWFVGVVVLAFVLSGFRGRVLASAALPATAIGSVVLKNFLVFGFIGLSSWAPLNVLGVMVEKLPSSERQALVEAGRLSPLGAVDSFGSIERLLPMLAPLPPTGEPVLDALRKSNGQPNENHSAVLAASRNRLPDAVAGLIANPEMYLVVVASSIYHFHRPANEFRDVRKNLRFIEGWTRFTNAVIGLQPAAWFGSSLDAGRPQQFWLQVSLGSILVSAGFVGACRIVGREVRQALQLHRSMIPEQVTLALLLWTGGFVFLVSTALDVLENNRARYTIAPLLTLGAACYLLRRWRAPAIASRGLASGAVLAPS